MLIMLQKVINLRSLALTVACLISHAVAAQEAADVRLESTTGLLRHLVCLATVKEQAPTWPQQMHSVLRPHWRQAAAGERVDFGLWPQAPETCGSLISAQPMDRGSLRTMAKELQPAVEAIAHDQPAEAIDKKPFLEAMTHFQAQQPWLSTPMQPPEVLAKPVSHYDKVAKEYARFASGVAQQAAQQHAEAVAAEQQIDASRLATFLSPHASSAAQAKKAPLEFDDPEGLSSARKPTVGHINNSGSTYPSQAGSQHGAIHHATIHHATTQHGAVHLRNIRPGSSHQYSLYPDVPTKHRGASIDLKSSVSPGRQGRASSRVVHSTYSAYPPPLTKHPHGHTHADQVSTEVPGAEHALTDNTEALHDLQEPDAKSLTTRSQQQRQSAVRHYTRLKAGPNPAYTYQDSELALDNIMKADYCIGEEAMCQSSDTMWTQAKAAAESALQGEG